ncbi:family 2 glycosyl transferase [Anopheles sinensis]|uniref:Family 2 glycosyl transferase n=1 Tax=Anopheles sinensis TaxID=74873 RepID=A0A084WDT4_ANOSI|nr:family 2 glycosyl transferase [Anopheles sinensis]
MDRERVETASENWRENGAGKDMFPFMVEETKKQPTATNRMTLEDARMNKGKHIIHGDMHRHGRGSRESRNRGLALAKRMSSRKLTYFLFPNLKTSSLILAIHYVFLFCCPFPGFYPSPEEGCDTGR